MWDFEHKALQTLFKKVRTDANLTQLELAKMLGKPQSYVSKFENGERRLDIIEVFLVCECCGWSLVDFSKELEIRISRR